MSVLGFVLFLLVSAACAVTGHWIASRLGISPPRLSEWLLARALCAWYSVVLIGLVLGTFGFFRPIFFPAAILAMGLLSLFLTRRLRGHGGPVLQQMTPGGVVIAAVLAWIFINNFASPFQLSDTIEYHLRPPAWWLQEGNFWEYSGISYEVLPTHYANNAILQGLLLCCFSDGALRSAGPIAYQIIIVLALYSLLRRWTPARWAPFTFVLLLPWLFLPHLFHYMYDRARNDLAVLAGTVAFLWAVLRLRHEASFSMATLAALAFGLGAGSKHSGVVQLSLVMIPGLVFLGTRQFRNLWRNLGFRRTAFLILIAMLPLGYWGLRNTIRNGNPFFPSPLSVPFLFRMRGALNSEEMYHNTTMAARFEEEPIETLEAFLRSIQQQFGPIWILLLLAPLLGLLSWRFSVRENRRVVLYLTVLCVSGILLWLRVPYGASMTGEGGTRVMPLGLRFLYLPLILSLLITFLVCVSCSPRVGPVLAFLGAIGAAIPVLYPRYVPWSLLTIVAVSSLACLIHAGLANERRRAPAAGLLIGALLCLVFYAAEKHLQFEANGRWKNVRSDLRRVFDYLDRHEPCGIVTDHTFYFCLYGKHLGNRVSTFEELLHKGESYEGFDTSRFIPVQILELARREGFRYMLVHRRSKPTPGGMILQRHAYLLSPVFKGRDVSLYEIPGS